LVGLVVSRDSGRYGVVRCDVRNLVDLIAPRLALLTQAAIVLVQHHQGTLRV
jgi:hypothetical protein